MSEDSPEDLDEELRRWNEFRAELRDALRGRKGTFTEKDVMRWMQENREQK